MNSKLKFKRRKLEFLCRNECYKTNDTICSALTLWNKEICFEEYEYTELEFVMKIFTSRIKLMMYLNRINRIYNDEY